MAQNLQDPKPVEVPFGMKFSTCKAACAACACCRSRSTNQQLLCSALVGRLVGWLVHCWLVLCCLYLMFFDVFVSVVCYSSYHSCLSCAKRSSCGFQFWTMFVGSLWVLMSFIHKLCFWYSLQGLRVIDLHKHVSECWKKTWERHKQVEARSKPEASNSQIKATWISGDPGM